MNGGMVFTLLAPCTAPGSFLRSWPTNRTCNCWPMGVTTQWWWCVQLHRRSYAPCVLALAGEQHVHEHISSNVSLMGKESWLTAPLVLSASI